MRHFGAAIPDWDICEIDRHIVLYIAQFLKHVGVKERPRGGRLAKRVFGSYRINVALLYAKPSVL